ncbi:hypothetical protein [Clostridium sp. UBA1652]|uniref:hypothetical protein n=1 Tax=Clostridium sp. UBA1652 TaxID=1946348 RepID=UPI00257D43F3|nr:hypothetical protein [Clostridium sp. UBA1652]
MNNIIQVADFKSFSLENKQEESDWDMISSIFSRAIKRKKLSEKQIKKIIEEVTFK